MRKRSDLSIFARMLSELGSLTPTMLLTITFGVLGFLASTAIPTIGAVTAVSFFDKSVSISLSTGIIVIIICAVTRGIFKYLEQLSGHYIAFKILAILRNKIFVKLRKLAPAKLDTKEKGNIISTITSDIELMEVFYAHTIAPVMIAIITSAIYVVILNEIHVMYGVAAIITYIVLGAIVPLTMKNISGKWGQKVRHSFGKSNSFLLDSLRGLREIIFLNNQKETIDEMQEKTKDYAKSYNKIKRFEGFGMALANLLVTAAIFANVFIGYSLIMNSEIVISQFIIALVLFSSSFGPVLALSALSTTLSSTLASAGRVFDILDEEPYVEQVAGNKSMQSVNIEFENVEFKYPTQSDGVLDGLNLSVVNKEKIALVGKSGCGKSTAVKLLMRYYDTTDGSISIDDENLKNIPTEGLRNTLGYTSQDTFLFNDTIENNIRMGDDSASIMDVAIAAQKAAIHDTITSFEDGYNTMAGEFGSRFSSGEKQRIALARMFLRNSTVFILDEPTSNLDVLNEAQILNSINKHCSDKTIILISHRKTTTGICERTYEIKDGKIKKII